MIKSAKEHHSTANSTQSWRRQCPKKTPMSHIKEVADGQMLSSGKLARCTIKQPVCMLNQNNKSDISKITAQWLKYPVR